MEIAGGMDASDGGKLGADTTQRNKKIAIFFALAASIGIFAGVSADLQRSSSSNGFCWSCVNAPSRSWSWWFGWGNCDCHAGWYGDCCDSPNPEISDIGEMDQAPLSDYLFWETLQTLASWGSYLTFWGAYDAEFWFDMVQIKTLDRYTSYFCQNNDRVQLLKEDGSTYDCGYLVGPGVTSKTFMEYDTIKYLVSNTPEFQEDGTIVDRGNELGLLRLNEAFYHDCDNVGISGEGSPMGGDNCGIGLGWSVNDHAYVRPYLDYLLGTPESTLDSHQDEFATTGTFWDYDSIKAMAETYLSGKTSITSKGSTGAWTSIVLHKLSLNMDITEDEANTFVAFQGTALKLAVLPDWVVDWFGFALGKSDLQSQKDGYINSYVAALQSMDFSGCGACESLDSEGYRQVAETILDSNVFAGGLSVPSVLQTALGAYKKWGGDSSGLAELSALNSYDDRAKLVMESVRYNPAVLGFPSIYGPTSVTNPAGTVIHDSSTYSSTYGAYNERLTPAVAMAGFDSVENAGEAGCSGDCGVDDFSVHRYADLTTWHAKSMDWADKAIHGTQAKYNRVCPAKDLSYTMSIAWLEVMDPDNWSCEGGCENLAEAGGPDWWAAFTMTKN